MQGRPVEESVQVPSCFVHRGQIDGIDHENDYVSLAAVFFPGVAESFLTAKIPHVERYFAFAHTTIIEPDRRYCVFIEFARRQRVSQCRLASILETNDTHFKLSAPELCIYPAEELSDVGNHVFNFPYVQIFS